MTGIYQNKNANPNLLFFSWMRLNMTLTVQNKISVKNIAKTFASGKKERVVHQSLQEIGLPSEKVRKATQVSYLKRPSNVRKVEKKSKDIH